MTGEHVELAYVDQGYTREEAAAATAAYGIEGVVVTLPEAKWGIVLLPCRWTIERDVAWASHVLRLARDYPRRRAPGSNADQSACPRLRLSQAPSFRQCDRESL